MSDPKIYIAGHLGMVGSSILRNLKKKKQKKIIVKKRSELDLFNQKAVFNFFKKEKIDQVYIAAARAGGIYANATYPAEFIYENLTIQEIALVLELSESEVSKIHHETVLELLKR